MKRSAVYEESDLKRQALGPIPTLANTNGLVSPPVTPEKKNRIINVVPGLGRKLNFNKGAQSPYNKVKEVFLRGSNAKEFDLVLPGREHEAALLQEYIEGAIAESRSESIYVSGPPGTGKTAQISAILDSLTRPQLQNSDPHKNIHRVEVEGVTKKVRIVNINCMTVRTAEDIFALIAESVTQGSCSGKGKHYNCEQMEELLASSKECDGTVLVLDEMDSIIGKHQQALFELFSWASKNANTKLVLIGIANALDLTDRFLPRLRSNRINPRVVQFLPYSADQIKAVILAKLKALEPGLPLPPYVHPTAVQFCAKKAAVSTGDLRKAFDIIHRAIELVEQATMKKMTPSEFQNLDARTAPKVMITQVAKVCSMAFSTNFQPKLDALNLQAKTLLCCLFKFEEIIEEKHAAKTVPSINSFFEFYNHHLHSVDRMLSTLKRSEFLEILSTLESNALVNLQPLADAGSRFMSGTSGTVGGAGGGSSKRRVVTFGNYRVSSNIPKREMVKAIGTIEILQRVMARPTSLA